MRDRASGLSRNQTTSASGPTSPASRRGAPPSGLRSEERRATRDEEDGGPHGAPEASGTSRASQRSPDNDGGRAGRDPHLRQQPERRRRTPRRHTSPSGRGALIALRGRSGSGKDLPLLNVIGGLDTPDGGTVHVDRT